MVAEVVVIPVAWTLLIMGIDAGVENVKFADVVGPPAPAEIAA